MNEIKIITDSSELKKLCAECSEQSTLAFDTEFMRDKTYYPKLSLVQLASDRHNFAVDMMVDMNFTPLKELFKMDKILKIFHSARQDLEVLNYFFGFIPRNIFDTQIATLFLGFKDSPSFESIIRKFLNKQVSKKLQFSDWLTRPLSDEQLQYALDDARLLYDVYSKIKDQLHLAKRYEWALEESNVLVYRDKLVSDVDDIFSKLSPHIKNHKDLSLSYKIVCWREKTAQTLDIPRNHLLKEEAIIEICAKKPRSLEKFIKTRTMLKNLSTKYSEELLSIIDAPSLEDESINEKLPKIKEQLVKNNLFVLIKNLLEVVSKDIGIQESFIASTSDLLDLAHNKESRVLKSWRLDTFGKIVQKFKNGQITLGMKNQQLFIHEI